MAVENQTVSELVPEPAPETTPETIEDKTELTDPDDIDALMDSMAAENQTVQDTCEPTEPSITDTTDEVYPATTVKNEKITPNPIIDDFSEDYVTPFLSADLSDLVSNEDSLADKTNTEELTDTDEDIDIDALLAEVNEETTNNSDLGDLGDIGDDLLATELDSNEGEDNNDELPSEFDQSTLTQLLNDEKESITAAELSTDYTDSSVLADLLADEYDERSPEKLTESAEINDIEQLNNLDFDELLSSIEEETPQNDSDDFDVSNLLKSDANEADLGDNLAEFSAEQKQDFITVDSLIADTLDDAGEKKSSEPYQQGNIDVGLGEFPEFTNNLNQLDVDDDDETGAAAKLDLAKVYIEIGDLDNAEVILMDVATIGDAEQQIEAKQLLDNLK